MNIISKLSLGASLQEIERGKLPPELSSGLDENPDVGSAVDAYTRDQSRTSDCKGQQLTFKQQERTF